MFNITQMFEDTLVEDALVVPIKSYIDYVTRIEIMKQYDTHIIFPNDVLCYLTPTESGDGEHTWLKVEIPTQDSAPLSVATIIVSDKTRNEALITLEDIAVVKQIGVASVLQELNKILQSYE